MTSDVILTEAALRDATEELLRHEAVFFDVETVGDHRGVPHLNTVTWMGLASDGICVSIPCGHPIGEPVGSHKEMRRYGGTGPKAGTPYQATVIDYSDPPPQISAGAMFGILEPVFMSERISKVAHGASFDLASVPKYYGDQVKRPYECNIVLDWVLDENHRQYNLKTRTNQIWGVEYDDKNIGRQVEVHPFSEVAKYLYLDTRYGWLQYKRNRPRIEREGLQDVYALELNILEIMVGMRQRGVRVDVGKLEEMRATLTVDVEKFEGRIYQAAGKKFNVNSVPQKCQMLFGDPRDGGQGLKGWKLTKTGHEARDRGGAIEPAHYSTDAEHLKTFPDNELAVAITDYQDVAKLLGTYVNGWLGTDPNPKGRTKEERDGKTCQIYDGRIHADFVQYGTKTGRFSCREPNLQNPPRGDTEHGKMLRDSFWADLECLLAVADYGQIEPRLMAHFLGQGMLYEGFLKGMDPYIVNAAAALGKDPGDITKGERQTYGKTMFLAMGYGLGHNGLAQKFQVSVAQAKKIIARHERNMPEVPAYKEALLKKARDCDGTPYITTILGRRRRVPELRYSEQGIRARAERQLFNSLIQGSAADIMKLAMWRTYCNLRGIPGAYIALTVHDELALNGPKDRIDDVAGALRDGMLGEGIQSLIRVPLKADVVIGARWGDCK